MQRFLIWIGLMVALGIATIAATFVLTRGDYPVARLVTEDPSLPSETVAGVKLHIRVAPGPAQAPTIIVLHGGPGGDFRSLQALDGLSDQYQVIFYDQRGAGLSERVGTDLLTLDGHLEELSGVIELFSPDAPIVLIGHSWGAMLAMAHLARNPASVQAAILIEPGYVDTVGHAAWKDRSRAYLSGMAYWREAILTGFRAQHIEGPDPSAAYDFLIGHMVGTFTNHPENPYHCGNGYTAPSWRFGGLSSDTWDKVAPKDMEMISAGATAFAGPVLFLAGSCNHWTGEPLQADHAARFQDASLVIIPRAGHDVVWDNPTASIEVIRQFLAGAL